MGGSTAAGEAVRLRVLGVTVDVLFDGPRHAADARIVRDVWHQCVLDRSTDPANAEVHIGDVNDVDALLHWLSQEVTLRAIDARAGELLMLHAAAVADPGTGAALAAIGPSGMGKSTWLRTHGPGRRYLSDETVAVHSDLGLVSHAKPVSVSGGVFKRQVPPGELGLLHAEGTEQLVGLWLLERDGSVPARLEPVELLDAVTLLAQHASHLPVTPRPLHVLADVIERCGGLFRARYAEAADLAPFVDDALAAVR
jgi:hypothetical protein